ncbi:hypothetical protein VTJ04DRAFT_7073 [Mycothermus thermophilus]|uniref:uncharacterized protein n=1 Tax=Humicola insolens TaxID=85995 RepID=UPI0037423F9F
MSLMNLPNEILAEICKTFVTRLRDTPDAILKMNDGDDLYYSRYNLVVLALTNRRLNAIATRFLYQTIRISNLDSLYFLVARLLEAPRLAELVSELSITANVGTSAYNFEEEDYVGFEELMRTIDHDINGARATYQRIVKLCPDLDSFFSKLFGQCGSRIDCPEEHHYRCPDGSGEAACALLLLLTSRVHTFHLARLSFHAPGYPYLVSIFDASMVSHVLPRLKRLLLASDPTDDSIRLPVGCPREFMVGRKINHVELQAPDLLDAESSWEMWEHVETLHMKDTYVSGTWWYLLSKEARPPLKEIEISVSPFDNEEQEVEDLESPGLNEALGFYTGTLQKLRVHLGDRMTIQEPYLGPQKRLACLSSMKVLTHLDISARLLFSYMDDMSNCNICDRLPSSLQRLRLDQTDDICLDDNPWLYWNQEDYDLVQATPSWDGPCYDTLFERALRQLAFESTEKLPCLEKVLVARRIVGWVRFGPPELGLTVTWTEERKTETAQDLRTMSFSPQRKS